ncbi:hypothetical protein JTB14_018395 [Gonioctena quinquepunctata]|nr:hypothetical protein JTB14_018395 [Gonioctena quinquepunctata]
MIPKLNLFRSKDKSAGNDPPIAATSRPMKYPYTFSAKIAQFPYRYYYDNSWTYRYYIFALAASMPVFMYISKLANSSENKAKWAEIRRKDEEEYRHKFD